MRSCQHRNKLRHVIVARRLTTRTANFLLAAEIDTIGALVALRSTDILGWRNAGGKTLFEVRMLLARIGLQLLDVRAPEGALDKQLVKELLDESALQGPITRDDSNREKTIYLATAPDALQKCLVSLVSDLSLSVRAQNVIKRYGAIYLGELVQLRRRAEIT